MVNISSNYYKVFKASIVRIYTSYSDVVGAGFMVSNQYLITCAHVIIEALNLPPDTSEAPKDSITLDFPLIENSEKITANVVFWKPIDSTAKIEDIAVLQINGGLPNTTQFVPLVTATNLQNHPIEIFGFPQGHNDGVWASGMLIDTNAKGWLQMEDIKVPGYQVEPGFSGAPVWDKELSGVVGMAVAAEKKREKVKAAFLIPTTILCQAWDKILRLPEMEIILDIREKFRIYLTDLIFTYYKNQEIDTQELLHNNPFPESISVLVKPDFLPDEPLEVSELDSHLVWHENEPSVTESMPQPDIDLASIIKKEKEKKLSEEDIEIKFYDGYLYRILKTDEKKFHFCPGRYFNFINTCEYLNYELAKAIAIYLITNGYHYLERLNQDEKYVKRIVGFLKENKLQVAHFLRENKQLIPIIACSDPWDFSSRCTAFGTCTIVVIKRTNKVPKFILNKRSLELSETPGLKHVIPAGTFQPNSNNDGFHKEEFSFVANIFREFIEELVEEYELRGNARPVFDHDSMYEDNEKGKKLRKSIIKQDNYKLLYLGMVIDPINLKPEILTVLMLHEGYVELVCQESFQQSWESDNIVFNDFTKERLAKILNNPEESFVPTGRAHIWLALKHFDYLSSKLNNV
ncbi:MAG: serine protease [Calothrix sp. MO_167.B42]|nr:serine protease [Calothrix sp. MO_167.B42]